MTAGSAQIGKRSQRDAGPTRLLRLALLALCLILNQPAAAAEVITHADHAHTPLGRELLRAIFTMRLREWPDHKPVRVFVMSDDDAAHDEFCRGQLGMYPYVLRNTWDRLVFTGTGLAPTQVHSEDEMRQKVQDTPGAIGYLSSSATAERKSP
jgi:hypothetical protein